MLIGLSVEQLKREAEVLLENLALAAAMEKNPDRDLVRWATDAAAVLRLEEFAEVQVTQRCPACSSRQAIGAAGVPGLRFCGRCGALYGEATRQQLSAWVLLEWDARNSTVATDTLHHFDVVLVGEGGNRVHGWYNPATRLVVQFG